MKQKAVKSVLHKRVHPPIAALFIALALVIVALSAIAFYGNSQKDNQVPLSNPTPTLTPIPTPDLHPWHINNTQQWVTYVNPNAPVTLQYPPQWAYKEILINNITGKTVVAGSLLLSQTPVQNHRYDGMYISWGGSFGGSPGCIAHPLIQLRNETLSACEYRDDKGNDRIEIDKFNLSLFIRTSASNAAAKAQILSILATLSFTK
jgi:hypothetical protein